MGDQASRFMVRSTMCSNRALRSDTCRTLARVKPAQDEVPSVSSKEKWTNVFVLRNGRPNATLEGGHEFLDTFETDLTLTRVNKNATWVEQKKARRVQPFG